MDAPADRNLLFGLLALQNGIIDQAALIVGFNTWTRDKARSMDEILIDQGAIDEDDRAALSGLAARHLKRHGDVAEKSLAAVAVGPSTREKLAALGDAELSVALPFVGSTAEADDPYRTASRVFDSPPPEGQRFRILRPHAKGGLGAVFVALDCELNREVALKEILDRHADDLASQARFLVEAEITGGLEHPGIVPVYGLGRYGDGRPYYAMRFIRGDSLKEAIAEFHGDESLKSDPGRRSLALRKLLRRFVDVCNAIDYAHGRGVLHRDLKPGNVIVGKHGETLVVDWGLAKAMGRAEVASTTDERTLMPSSSSGSAETLPGSALGTPSYMSPEQAAGDLDRLGPRSDVYSLGATLYCLLTGRAPFEGTDLGALLRDVRKGAFPHPRQVDPSIDRALEAVCLKAMATRPEGRHATARALADDVERWAADEPTSAWREPASARARRWMRRNRSVVLAASAAVLMALVGLAGVLAVESRANASLAAKNKDLDRANRLKDEANAGLLRANERVQARFDLAREAIRSFQDGVNEDDMLKGEELKGLRDKLLRSAAGFYEKLEKLLQGQADLASRAILAQSYSELGELTEKIGIQPEALAVHRKALAIRRELAATAGGDAKLDAARSLNDIGWLAGTTGDAVGALAAYEEARGLAEPLATGPGATDAARDVLGTSHHRIALALSNTGKSAEALVSYRRALAIREELAEADPRVTRFRSNLATTYDNLGILQEEIGQSAEALGSYRRALAIREELAEGNPAVTELQSLLARSHNNLGDMQKDIGQSAEALASHGRALAILEKLAEGNPSVTDFRNLLAKCHFHIGQTQMEIGQPIEALESYRRALAIWGKLAENNPDVIDFRTSMTDSLYEIGWLMSETGHPEEALKSYRRALAIIAVIVEDNPIITRHLRILAHIHYDIGIVQSNTGHSAEALESFLLSFSIYSRLAREDAGVIAYQVFLANTLEAIGGLRGDSGQAVEASEAFARAVSIREKLAGDHPAVPAYRANLAECLNSAATFLLKIGRPSEAHGRCERAFAILEPLVRDQPETPRYRYMLAVGCLRFGQAREAEGDLAGAAVDWRRAVAIFQASPGLDGVLTFLHGSCHASLAKLGGQGEAEASEAMALLRRAVAMGYRDASAYRNETALDAIRSRPDFQLLMMDLTFPADPFSR